MEPRWRVVKRRAALRSGRADPRQVRRGRAWFAACRPHRVGGDRRAGELLFDTPPTERTLALALGESIPAAQLPPRPAPGPNRVPPTRPALASADQPRPAPRRSRARRGTSRPPLVRPPSLPPRPPLISPIPPDPRGPGSGLLLII